MNTDYTHKKRESVSSVFICGFWFLVILLPALTSLPIPGQQSSTQISPEEIAFAAVSAATNPAARLAAAEDFVARFPKSSRRSHVAKLVSEQLTVLRNPEIAISLLDRARTIFTSSAELEFLKPAALEVYANGDRADEAFALASDLLSRKPYELGILMKMTSLGVREARNKKLKYAELSLGYGLRAIEIIEKEQRPTGITDEAWAEEKSKLSGLYQQIGIIKVAQEKIGEAKLQIVKAIQIDPQDPSNFALLGRVLNGDYEKLVATYQEMPDGSARQDEKKRLDSLLDEIIDAYAHAAGLAIGKLRYQILLQQVIPDLTRFYKYRHNDSTAGLQQLIDRYKR